MQFRSLLLILLLFGCTNAVDKKTVVDSYTSDSLVNVERVKEIMEDFRTQNKTAIAGKIAYPLNREFPLPPIESEQEMLQRFTEVFDDELTGLIVNSDLAKDWNVTWYRGILLLHGALWIGHDGQIVEVNHTSEIERQKRLKLIDLDRAKVHPSLRDYSEPILRMITDDYQIRIDKLADESYRYAAWKPGVSMSQKPELTIRNGQRTFEGSGGNHSFTFVNGHYTYICGIQELGFEDIPGELTVLKNGKEVLVQPIKSLHY